MIYIKQPIICDYLYCDDTSTIDGEKNSFANVNSTRGFEVVDMIKSTVDKAYRALVVSCIDNIAVAAHDFVVDVSSVLL